MRLDRWIIFVFLVICLAYGYVAWVEMDSLLLPFERSSPILPSTFPKGLSVLGVLSALMMLIGPRFRKFKNKGQEASVDAKGMLEEDSDLEGPVEYKVFQTCSLLALMVFYAFALRPLGFLFATFSFLALGSFLLGERRIWLVLLISSAVTFVVWYLVHKVLGIYLSPFPWFI